MLMSFIQRQRSKQRGIKRREESKSDLFPPPIKRIDRLSQWLGLLSIRKQPCSLFHSQPPGWLAIDPTEFLSTCIQINSPRAAAFTRFADSAISVGRLFHGRSSYRAEGYGLVSVVEFVAFLKLFCLSERYWRIKTRCRQPYQQGLYQRISGPMEKNS